MGVKCSPYPQKSTHGGSYSVFKIVLEDSVQWAARVCHRHDEWEYDLRATKIFQHIKQRTPGIKGPKRFLQRRAPYPILRLGDRRSSIELEPTISFGKATNICRRPRRISSTTMDYCSSPSSCSFARLPVFHLAYEEPRPGSKARPQWEG